jgi:hypothetical protein
MFDLSLERTKAGHGWPSGKDARVRDSLRLREDTTLLSCLRPSGLLTKSNSPNPNSLKQKEKTEQRDKYKAPLKFTSAQTFHKFHLVIYTATWPRY